ncbi:MAG: autotransporter domain-containing protein, partial [Chlamydiae bacterium]|nr:autotransporter domain-containing protein [Chlamydiota bacterium]
SSSTLTLTGVNTYTGETNILGGVLALSGSGSIATSTLVNVVGTLDVQAATGPTIQTLLGSGQIILGPDLTINQGAPGTFSGQITGPSGGLILGSSSTAALTLSGSNTYLGATQIQGGTLAMAGSGSIALSQTVSVLGIFDISAATSPVTIQSLSGSGNILLGSQRLNVIQQFPLTFSGVISDTGGLTLSNLGKSDLVLSGVNTYTGTTEIFGGTLVLSGSGDISSSSAVIVDAVLNIAELSASSTTIQNLSGTSSGFLLLGTKNCVIEQPLDQTFSGMVLGTSGGLTKMGGGQLTLLGSNSFTGVITVGQGTLVGNTKSLPSSIVNNGSLIFQMTESGTYAKSISGVGALQKTGSAALTLTGINSYTGNTTVAEGTLTVNGSIPNSPIFVLPGARLKGIGTIKSVQVQGAVNPGTSSGTLYVAGDATFVTGSTYEVTLDSKGVSDLVATGTITIQSGVLCEIDPEDGFLSSFAAPHRILEGGSILGIFSAVTSTSPLVSGRLVYHPSFVDLFIELLPLTSLGLEGNSKQVAEAIDEVLASGNHALDGVAASLYPLSFSEINAALNQMQPALYKGFVASQENNLVNMQEMLHVRMQQELDFMRCDPLDKKKEPCSLQKKVVHVWTSGFGDNLHQSSTTYAQSPQVGYQDNTGGIVAGVDGRFATYCYLGAFGGYTSSSLTWDDTQGQGTIQSGYGGLYFSVLGRMFYANLAVLGGFGSCFGHRNISYPGVRETAYESYSGQQILSHIDTGVNWNIHGWTLRPFDSLDYIASTAAGFTESGAGAYDLIVSPSSAIMLRNELGLEFAYCFCVQGYKWNLAPSTSWIREIRVSGSTYTATFINTDVPFTVTGYLPSRNLFSPGCILSGAFWKDHLLLNFYYKGMFGSGYTEQSYGGQVQLRF